MIKVTELRGFRRKLPRAEVKKLEERGFDNGIGFKRGRDLKGMPYVNSERGKEHRRKGGGDGWEFMGVWDLRGVRYKSGDAINKL